MKPENVGQQFPKYSGEPLAEVGSGWRTHALGERQNRPEGEPGAKWDRYTALVPVSHLAGFMEYDRAGKQPTTGSSRTIDSLTKEMSQKGSDAIREPLQISYDHRENWGVLVEGNHRLAAAMKAGVTHLPAVITRGADHRDNKRNQIGAPLNVDMRIVDKSGYMPSTIHPGNFKQFEGYR